MTLDEAIEHAKQVANTCDNSECAANHMQLAEWLRRARGADKAARWYTSRIQKLETENAKLRDERNHWRVEQVHAHSNWVDAYERAIELELENAKLRKLIAEWYPHMKKRVGVDALWQWGHMAVIRELRVEVD